MRGAHGWRWDDRYGKLARNSEFRAPIIDQHIAYLKKMCDDLNQIEKLFKGRKKQRRSPDEIQATAQI